MGPFDLSIPSQLSAALGPDLFLMAGAMALMLWAAWRPESDEHQRQVGYASLALTFVTVLLVILYAKTDRGSTDGPIAVDRFRWGADLVFLIATGLTIALGIDYNRREGILPAESHVLVLFATSGMMVLAAARDLIIVFLGIEIMSIAVYVLAGLNRRSARAAEGALKYFLLGSFSTGFLLYGIALVYGATGSTNLTTIGARIAQFDLTANPLLLTGVALLVIGFGFKVAAAPFHMWAPDVYEGAPTPITAYMAAAVKAAAFAAFLRVWNEAFGMLPGSPASYMRAGAIGWHSSVWWLAVATMIVGNLVALSQRNLKRVLAYSSIAHAGYILVAVVVGGTMAGSAFLFYLLAYTLATMGAFAVIVALGNVGERNLMMDDYAGLWTARPWLAVAMSVFMLALLGFPVFGGMGFFAKWYMLQAALQGQYAQNYLAVWLVLTSLVSAGYYLRVVMVMFMRPRPEGVVPAAAMGGLTRLVIGATAVLIIVFGILPNPVVWWARNSVASLPMTSSFVERAPASDTGATTPVAAAPR
jgi:NADH-quinone oxidoreductase subunit N